MAASTSDEVVRIAAVGDIHCARTSAGTLQPLFAQVAERADVLVLCGDLTDYGLPEEAQILVEEIPGGMKTPIIAVLGNHDYESDQQDEVRQILVDAGMIVLDGESCEVAGIGFAGVKGFAGGFGRGTLGAWGEPAVKVFVQEAIDEALKLETGPGSAPDAAEDRRPALRADPRDRRERAARDLPVPRLQPPRRAAATAIP